MTIDAEQIKASVDIVDIIGKFVELKQQGSGLKGCCPFHDEKDGSFNVNPATQSFKCFGCDEQGDVIDFIVKHKALDFKAACEFLGADIDPAQKPKPRKKAAKKKPAKPVPLPYKAAKDHYTPAIMQDRADYILNKDPDVDPHILIKPGWAFKNEKGEVELVSARFEDKSGHKTVLSMYWNGKTIKLKDYPVLLFNRDLLAAHPEKPVLIVEGEKSAKAAEVLTDFIATTWNGGHAKAKDANWSPLKNREVFYYPDDDQQKYKGTHPKAGQILPPAQQPGIKTAAQIKKKLPHAKIVKPLPAARELKASGADIVEALECMDAEQLTAYILDTKGDKQADILEFKNKENGDISTSQPDKEVDKAPPSTDLIYPFKILGVADDGKAYIIGCNDRMYSFNPMSFSKAQLYNLADIEYWQGAYEQFGQGGKMWDQAISDLVQAVNVADFDPDLMRGRGAWREKDGRVCYHDGRNTIGEYSSKRIYLRRSHKDIGIKDKPATAKQRTRIMEACRELTFDSLADMVRTLGWATLAPFAGALPWRPAGLLTAASGTGKTTIVNEIIKPLAMPKICSGGESTAAGIRQNIGIDSAAMVVEEAETDTQKKKQYRDDTFSLMRQSTSDDSPDVLKGTIDGRGLSFTLRSMFFFVSISPEVECEADENRIFRVSLVKACYKRSLWLEKEKELRAAITPDVCRGVRAYTWKNLADIIKLAERVAVQAQLVAEVDNRTAFAESLLLAAYIAVYKDKPDADTDFIVEFVKLFYKLRPLEQRRNENEEMVDIILDSIVREGSSNYTIRELLNAIETGRLTDEEKPDDDVLLPPYQARRIAGRHGIGLSPSGDIAIAKNHKEVMKMLDKGRGYHQQLVRHPRLVERSKNISLGSRNTKGCVVIGWDQDGDGDE